MNNTTQKISVILLVMAYSFFASAQNAKVYDMVPYRKDSLWGFADIAKTVLIQPQYKEIRFFNEEITAVRKDKWGFIDKHGQPVTPFKYDVAGDFKEGMCQVRIGNKVGYVNEKGKEVVKMNYQFSEEFSEGLAVVSDSTKGKLISKVIDKNGKEILSNLVVASSQFHSGYIAVKENDQTYFINRNGKKMDLPEGAEIYFQFSEDVALVKLRSVKITADSLYSVINYLGIINAAGKLLKDTVKDIFGNKLSISANQRVITNFTNGFAIVQRSSLEDYTADKKVEYAFVDKKGKMSMWYSAVRTFSPDGRSLVVSTGDSTVKIIDINFKTIPPYIKMADAGTFSEGLLRVKFAADGKWGFINEKGEIVIEPVYEECSDFSGGIAAVTRNGKHGFINKNGLQFWEN